MTKVPCTECGTMILPRTAQETGGICMACKQGIRASMEASREFYRKMKEYDPAREHWEWLVREAAADFMLQSFSEANRHIFAVGVLQGEVFNGGFDQFFSNTSGAYYEYVRQGLKALDAKATLTIVESAARAAFGDKPPPIDRQMRWDAMYRQTGILGWARPRKPDYGRLDEFDRLFYDDRDSLGEKVDAFMNRHGLLEAFERPG